MTIAGVTMSPGGGLPPLAVGRSDDAFAGALQAAGGATAKEVRPRSADSPTGSVAGASHRHRGATDVFSAGDSGPTAGAGTTDALAADVARAMRSYSLASAAAA